MSTTVSGDHAGAGGHWLPSDLHLRPFDSRAMVAGFIGQAGRWQPAYMTKPDYSTVGAKSFGQRILTSHSQMLTKHTLMPKVRDMISKKVAVSVGNLAHIVPAVVLNIPTMGLEIKKLHAVQKLRVKAKWLDPATHEATKECTHTLANLERYINMATSMRNDCMFVGRKKKKDSTILTPFQCHRRPPQRWSPTTTPTRPMIRLTRGDTLDALERVQVL